MSKKRVYYKPIEYIFYREFKDKIFSRDKYQCVNCSTKENLTIHHIIPVINDFALEFDEKNVILLCERCHCLAHLPECKREEYIRAKKMKVERFKYFKWFKLEEKQKEVMIKK